MTCRCNIATRTGLHLACSLEYGHDGECMPRIGRPALFFNSTIPAVEWPEAAFVGHLLAIIESAGDTLTFLEALNVARTLLRARIGRAPF